MEPATIALISAGISAAGSAAGGLFGRQKEQGIDRRKRELVDDLLASVKGEGPFTKMFQADEGAFQKSFVEPAKQMFQSQIAPQIQQSYIASGQQRGTGLEDALARAGVDLDQMLNTQYMQFQQSAYDRSQNAINNILGTQYGPQTQSRGSAMGEGFGEYLAGDKFGADIGDIISGFQKKPQTIQDTFVPPRSGFVNDQVYNPYTGIQQDMP